jgi:hypothetical protein
VHTTPESEPFTSRELYFFAFGVSLNFLDTPATESTTGQLAQINSNDVYGSYAYMCEQACIKPMLPSEAFKLFKEIADFNNRIDLK